MQEKASSKNVPVLVDHIHLFHPAYLALKKYVGESGKKVRWIRSAGGNHGPFRSYVSSLWDYGPHDLAMAMELMGDKPEILAAREENLAASPEGAQNFQISTEFRGGVRHEFRVGNFFEAKTRWFAVGLGDEVVIFNDLAERKLTVVGGDHAPAIEECGAALVSQNAFPSRAIPYRPSPALSNCLQEFVRGLQGSRDYRWGLHLGVSVVELLEAAESL